MYILWWIVVALWRHLFVASKLSPGDFLPVRLLAVVSLSLSNRVEGCVTGTAIVYKLVFAFYIYYRLCLWLYSFMYPSCRSAIFVKTLWYYLLVLKSCKNLVEIPNALKYLTLLSFFPHFVTCYFLPERLCARNVKFNFSFKLNHIHDRLSNFYFIFQLIQVFWITSSFNRKKRWCTPA